MKKKILISTGGSGGHVIPATTIYDHLKNNFEVIISTDLRGLNYLDVEKHKIFEIDTHTGEILQIYEPQYSQHKLKHAFRGGSQLIPWSFKNRAAFLGVGHCRRRRFDYRHFFYIMDGQPPFKLLCVTKFFKLQPKYRVEFASGLFQDETFVYIAFGLTDCKCMQLKVNKHTVMDLLFSNGLYKDNCSFTCQ